VLDSISVATRPTHPTTPWRNSAVQTEIACYRGPLERRPRTLLRKRLGISSFDGIVRLSGDSPLLDPALVNQSVKLFRRGGWDLVTNVQIRSFPKGQSVEVVSAGAFSGRLTRHGRRPSASMLHRFSTPIPSSSEFAIWWRA